MSAFCNCQKGDSILKLTKRIFSGLLAAMMLFTTAFAVNDSATTKAANALTFAFKPITGSEYDSTALQTDLAAAQKIISQRMQLEGLTGASAAVSGDVITVSIPKTATGNTAAYWAARLGDRRLCSVTDFLNEEWQFDRADFASAKATTENGAEAVEIDLTDSGKTKLTEAHNKVKAYLADSKNDADKAQWLTFHWGTTTFRMLVDDSFSDSKLVIGGDSDPLRAGASKYMPQYLIRSRLHWSKPPFRRPPSRRLRPLPPNPRLRLTRPHLPIRRPRISRTSTATGLPLRCARVLSWVF